MADRGPGPAIVLTAGSVTFVNEWLQTQKPNWRVPVATLLGAWMMMGIDRLDSGAATGLSLMVLFAALVTPFAGHSPLQTFMHVLPTQPKSQADIIGTPPKSFGRPGGARK